jgi:preprotein translocase subunit SecB
LLQGVHLIHAEFHTGTQEPAGEEPESEGIAAEIGFAWDWQIVGARAFQVMIKLETLRAIKFREQTTVQLVGTFEATPGAELSVQFQDFVRSHAPAILLPYAREVVSSITSRGPLNTLYVPPLNVKVLMEKMDPEAATGAQALRDNATRRAFELA